MVSETISKTPANKLDTACGMLCALIPIGVVIGTVVFEFFIGLIGLVWIVRCTMGKHNPIPALKSNWLFLALLCFNLSIYLSVLVNGPGDKGLLNDLAFLRFLILAAALVDISNRIAIEKYMIFGLLSAVVLGAINTLAAHSFGFDLIGKSVVRYSAKAAEAKRIAGVCTYAGSFFFAWSILDRKLEIKQKSILFFICFICMVLVFKTGIKTLIISLVAGMTWVFFLFAKRRVSNVLAVFIILLAIGAAFIGVKSGQIGLHSFWDRFHIWKVNYVMWQKQPLVGVGPFSFRSEYRDAMANAEPGEFAFQAPDGEIFNSPEIQFHSHSLVMMILTSTGLIGVFFFFGLFLLSCRKIMKNDDGWREGLNTWPVVLFSVGLTGFNIFDPWYFSLFIFFLILIGCAQKRPGMQSNGILCVTKKNCIRRFGVESH